MAICIVTVIGTVMVIRDKGADIFAEEESRDLNDIRTKSWDAFQESKDLVADFGDDKDDDCIVESWAVKRKCDKGVYPQQTQSGGGVLTLFIEKDGGNLFTEANLKEMKAVEEKILLDSKYPDYCLRWDKMGYDKSCDQPLSPLGLFYADHRGMSGSSNEKVFDDVDRLDGSLDGILNAFNTPNLAADLSMIHGTYSKQMRNVMKGEQHSCATTGKGKVQDLMIESVQKCLMTMSISQTVASASAGQVYDAMFPLMVSLTRPRAQQLQNIEKTLKLAAYMQKVGFYAPLVDYFFDKGFSVANPISTHSRGVIRFGYPLEGYKNRDDNEEKQEEKFGKWFRDSFNDYLQDTKEKGKVEVLFFATPLIRDEFISLILMDVLKVFVSLGLVFVWIFLQTNSIVIAIAGLSEIILSVPLAFFFYYTIFGFKYFDGLNAMTIFIVAAIGADDIFVFMDQYKQSSYHPEVCVDLKTRMNWVYSRASWAMLITSLTTCAAFVCTAVSPLPSIQSFGIFSAFVIMADYVLVITWFPCCVVLYHNYLENRPCCPCCCCGAGQDRCCDVRCRIKELWPCTWTMERTTDQVKARGSAEMPTKRLMERVISGPMAGFLGGKIGAVVVVVFFLLLLIPATILGTGIEPVSRSEEALPSDHPFQRIWTLSEAEFPSSAQNTNTPAFVVWGVEGINNDDVNPIRDGQTEKGKVVWDKTFKFDKPAQQHIWNVCEEVRLMKANLGEFLSRDKDSPINEGKVECPLYEWKHYLESKGETFPLALSRIPSVMPGFLESNTTNDYGQKQPMKDKLDKSFGYDPNYEGGSVRFVVVEVATQLQQRASHAGDKLKKNYDLFEGWMDEMNSPTGRLIAPPTANNAFQTCDGGFNGPMWIWMHTQGLFKKSAIQGSITGTILAFVVILFATGQIIIAFSAFVTIAAILITVLAMMKLANYELGTITSICITILAGFAVDYVVHLAHAYNHSEKETRDQKFQEAFEVIGVSVLSGMVTSVLASFVLLTCSLQFFAKFGFFLIFTVAWAWIWGNTFFMCLMRLIGPDQNTHWILQLPYSALPEKVKNMGSSKVSASKPTATGDA